MGAAEEYQYKPEDYRDKALEELEYELQGLYDYGIEYEISKPEEQPRFGEARYYDIGVAVCGESFLFRVNVMKHRYADDLRAMVRVYNESTEQYEHFEIGYRPDTYIMLCLACHYNFLWKNGSIPKVF